MLYNYGGSRYNGYGIGTPRLGIPDLKINDGPQGFRWDEKNDTATYFPAGVKIGATWSVDAAYKWGETMAKEYHAKGANVQLGPALNVHRIPINGRNFEYVSGEDPILGKILAKPIVEGIQS